MFRNSVATDVQRCCAVGIDAGRVRCRCSDIADQRTDNDTGSLARSPSRALDHDQGLATCTARSSKDKLALRRRACLHRVACACDLQCAGSRPDYRCSPAGRSVGGDGHRRCGHALRVASAMELPGCWLRLMMQAVASCRPVCASCRRSAVGAAGGWRFWHPDPLPSQIRGPLKSRRSDRPTSAGLVASTAAEFFYEQPPQQVLPPLMWTSFSSSVAG